METQIGMFVEVMYVYIYYRLAYCQYIVHRSQFTSLQSSMLSVLDHSACVCTTKQLFKSLLSQITFELLRTWAMDQLQVQCTGQKSCFSKELTFFVQLQSVFRFRKKKLFNLVIVSIYVTKTSRLAQHPGGQTHDINLALHTRQKIQTTKLVLSSLAALSKCIRTLL